MNFRYEIILSVDLGAAIPKVGDMLKRVNDALSECGQREKLSVRSKLIRCSLTSGRLLTSKDRDDVKKTLIETFYEHQPAWKVQVESFRRQSGNVQQSAA